MHRIVTKVKALLIRSGRAFAPSYISVGSRNYSVIIVKAIHQSSFFHRSCRILNATYLVSTEFLLFVLTRRAWRKKKKKNFKRKNKKSSQQGNIFIIWFFLSLFFFLLLKSTLISGNSGKIGRGIGSRSQIFKFSATSGTFSPVFLSALTSRLVAALFSAHHRLEAAHVRVLPARNN